MTVLLPVEDDKSILTNNTLGFQPLQQQWGLSEISKQITSGVPDEKDTVIVNAGETAIPDVCAHVQYLRAQLKAGNYLDMTDESVKAWVGVMAIIALSEYRKFNLKVTTIDMNGGDPMLSVYREALNSEGLLDAQGRLHVLRLSGNPIAVMDVPGANNGKRCFCYPFSTIDNKNEVMNNIPWFLSGGTDSESGKRTAHRWDDVTGTDQRTSKPYLNDTEQALFAEWLDALRRDSKAMNDDASCVDYSEAVTSVLKQLQTDVVNHTDGSLVSVEATFNSPNARPENLNAWRGVLACVGLSKMRGSKITFESYRARADEDSYRNVLLRHNQTNEFILVLVNGARVGRLDEELLICPLYCVTDDLKNIPWYQNGHWVDIVNDVADHAMNTAERRRLAEWYRTVSLVTGQVGNVSQQLQASAQMLEDAFGTAAPGGQTEPLEHGTTLPNSNPMPNRYNALLGMFCTVPAPVNPLPDESEMFTDRLVLTTADTGKHLSKLGLTTKHINNRVSLMDSDAHDPISETFLALLPLRSSFTAMFSKDPNGVDLKMFQLTAEGNNTITATITLNNGGLLGNYSKTYNKGEILYYAEFPYLAMWPYINADSWKEYYVAWCQDILSNNNCISELPWPVEWDEAPLVPVAPHEDVSTYDNAPKPRWKLLTYDHFPEYVHFKFVDGGDVEVGAIYTDPPQMRHVEHSGTTYYAAIDFGSSNTIVRLMDQDGKIVKEDGGEPYKVFTNKYVQPLTMNASQVTGYYNDEVKNFHEFYWLPFCGNVQKVRENHPEDAVEFWERRDEAKDQLPTVVEVYSGASKANNKAPRYGQLLRSNCNVMSHFLVQKGELSRQGNTLDALGIRSHIKMKKRGAKTPLYDGQIAIQMILLDCALAAIEHNARLSFVLSYPDDRMWGTLKQFWTPAAENAQQICASINFNTPANLLRTTELYAAHFYATDFAQVAIPPVGYCILDIGGGTTDISLWKGTGAVGPGVSDAFMGGLSLKYAGDQLTAESIFSFYRRLSGTADANFDDFKGLWNLQDASLSIKEYESGMEEGFEKLVKLDLGIDDNLKMVHEEVPLLSTMIVSELSWSKDVTLEMAEVQPFLALLRTKVISIFYVVAHYLHFTGAYDTNMSDTPYIVCMAGNGSKAYEFCGEGMETMVVNILRTIVANRNFSVFSPDGYRKTEVVNGMCALTRKIMSDKGSLNVTALRQPPIVPVAGYGNDIEVTDYKPMWDAYCYYVEYILKNADYFSRKEGFLNVDGDTTIYQMLTVSKPENRDRFNKDWHSILNQVWNECGSGTPNFIKVQIAAIKLADRILLLDAYK